MTNKQQLIENYGMKAVKIAAFVIAIFLMNTTANAQVEAGKQVQIVALHSNKCVDVSEVSTRSGQAIHQFKCLETDNQNWEFEPKMVGNEVAYKIKARHSGKCLDVEGGKTGNGTPIIQWDCNGGNNQLWIPKELGGGYQLKSVSAGKCLDVHSLSVNDGAKMQIWDCGGAEKKNQLFKLTLIAAVANIEFASFDSNRFLKKADNDYIWTGGAPFERTIYNPLDGGVLLRYKQDIAQGNSDGCSNPTVDPYKTFYQQACFAHDTNYSAPFQLAGFPNYESDGSSTGKDLADYLFLKDMLLINKVNREGKIDRSLGDTTAYTYFRAVQDFGGFRGSRGKQEILEKGGVVAVKNYGVYIMRLRVTWTSPKGERKIEEVTNVGGRAATIPLSVGARDIVVEATAVGGKQIFKETLPGVGMYAYTVGGTVQSPDLARNVLKADFGDKLVQTVATVETFVKGEKIAAGERAIKFNNQAGYVAEMTVMYFVNQDVGNGVKVPQAKTLTTPKISAGFTRPLIIPKDALSNLPITVTITGVGTIKNPVFTTAVPAKFTGELCFKAYATIFDAKGSEC